MKIKNIKGGYTKEVKDSIASEYIATGEWEIPKETKVEKAVKEGK